MILPLSAASLWLARTDPFLYYLIRVVEDYGVIYLGSAVFKIARLLFIAMFSVHFFACIFFRVKIVSAATEDDVIAFYTSKNVAQDVSLFFCKTMYMKL
jgi:hypothetical protein